MTESVHLLEKQLTELENCPGTEMERVNVLLQIAESLREDDDWDRLLAISNQAFELSGAIGYRGGIAAGLADRAFVSYMRSDFQAAIPPAVRALQIAEECGETSAEGLSCAVLALVHWSLGDYDSALRFCERAQIIYEKRGNRMMMGHVYLVRGQIAQSFGELSEALDWVTKGHELFHQDQRKVGESRALAALGGLYRHMSRPEDAIECASRGLVLAEESGNQLAVSRVLNDLAGVYRDLGRSEDALAAYSRALDIRRQEGYRSAEITTHLDLADFHLYNGNFQAGIEHALTGLALADELGVKPKASHAHHLLSRLYEASRQYQSALLHLKEHQQLHALISQDQTAARLKTSELIASLERLRAEQASVVENEKRTALTNLAGALAHEMNSPLGALHSCSDSTVRCAERLIESLNGGPARHAEAGELLEILKKNAAVLTSATRRVEAVFERFRNFLYWNDDECHEVDLIESIQMAIAFLTPRQNISVVTQLQPLPKICGNPIELNQVFLQLLANAEQSIPAEGEVRVTTRADGDRLLIEVADTGRGIPPDRLPKLFEPGFNLNDSRVKASFSLFACQHVIRRHGGEIQVSSELGRGSVFTVVLPAARQTQTGIYALSASRPS
jgi:signal transduction histidine kinase